MKFNNQNETIGSRFDRNREEAPDQTLTKNEFTRERLKSK